MTNDRFSLSTIHALSFPFQSMFSPRLIRPLVTKATRIIERQRKKAKIDISLCYWDDWMMKLTSWTVPVQASSIVVEDFLIDARAWSEVSVQVLVGNNNVFLSGNRRSIFILNVIEEIYANWVRSCEERCILSTWCFFQGSQLPIHWCRCFPQ